MQIRTKQIRTKQGPTVPPICGCCGSTLGSFFTNGQIKHPVFSQIAAMTHSSFDWIFDLLKGKK